MGRIEAVEIATKMGSQIVPADFIGPFAIHRAIGQPGWAVTHTTTGYSVYPVLRHKASAEAMARALESQADWSFATPSAVGEWSRYRRDKVKGIVRGFVRDDELGRFTTPALHPYQEGR